MDITSPTVDRSQADGPTATRSQQQKAAAVQKAVAARKQRYLACAFPIGHRSDDGAVLGAATEPAKSAFFRNEDKMLLRRL